MSAWLPSPERDESNSPLAPSTLCHTRAVKVSKSEHETPGQYSRSQHQSTVDAELHVSGSRSFRLREHNVSK